MMYGVLANLVSNISCGHTTTHWDNSYPCPKFILSMCTQVQVLRQLFMLQIACFLVFCNQPICTLLDIRNKIVQLLPMVCLLDTPLHVYSMTGPDIALDTLFPYRVVSTLDPLISLNNKEQWADSEITFLTLWHDFIQDQTYFLSNVNSIRCHMSILSHPRIHCHCQQLSVV